MNSLKLSVVMSLVLALASISLAEQTGSDKAKAEKASVESDLLSTEKLSGEVWLSPNVKQLAKSARRVTVKVWFEDQFLGRGDSYKKRAQEFSKSGRRQLRKQVVATLQKTSDATFAVVEKEISKLKEARKSICISVFYPKIRIDDRSNRRACDAVQSSINKFRIDDILRRVIRDVRNIFSCLLRS